MKFSHKDELIKYEIYNEIVCNAVTLDEKAEIKNDLIGNSYLPSEFSGCHSSR